MPIHTHLALHTQDLTPLVTIRDWLRFYMSVMTRQGVFFGHGSATALDESAYLIQHTLHLPMGDISPFLDAHLIRSECERLTEVLAQRVEQRVPASYITGESWLQGQRFVVDRRVIIPRSFIAELLADQLSPWVEDPEEVAHVLDLCTGSGCLGILAAHTFPNAMVDCVDLSLDALEVARLNIDAHQVGDRVTPIESDLYQALGNRQYDIILSNPPYVNEESMQQLPAEYLHEPRMALAGGDDGMDLIRTIINKAAQHLTDQGILIIELGNERAYFEAAFPELNPIWLEVSAGDEQVFLLRKDDLLAFAS